MKHSGAIDAYRDADGRLAALVVWPAGSSFPVAAVKRIESGLRKFTMVTNDDAPWPIRESHLSAEFTIDPAAPIGVVIHSPSISDPGDDFILMLQQSQLQECVPTP